MTSFEVFRGSFLELLSMFCILNLFDDYEQKWWKGVLITAGVAAITVFTDLMGLDFALLGYVINYASVFLCFSIFFKKNIIHVIFECFFSTAIIMSVEFVLVFLILDVSPGEVGDQLVLPLSILLIITFSLSRWTKLKRFTRATYNRFRSPLNFIVGNLFLIFIATKYLWDVNSDLVYNDFTTMLVIICFWWVVNAYLMKKLISEQNHKKTIRFHEQYGEMAQLLLDELYEEQHDFRKHLQAIEGLTYMVDPKQSLTGIRSYIEALGTVQEIKEDKTVSFHMGNSAIDGLLYAKHKEAAQEKISFYYIPGETFPSFPCHLYELTELLGNLLDNAFDYVIELPPEERKILVRIGTNEKKPCIEVRNTYYAKEKENFEMMKKKGYSTKAKNSGERRGYGLYNVKRICAKYQGHLHIFYEDGQLVIQALF